MFKNDWEKTEKVFNLQNSIIEKIVQLAMPARKLESFKLIAGGCANLNYKIQMADDNEFYILRIYLRDRTSCYREENIGKLLKDSLPVPQILYIGTLDDYCFSIGQFMPGITLRDLLLSNEPCNINDIMYEVGTTLAKIAKHKFSNSGFFDQDLNIISEHSQDGYLNFAKECLKNKIVLDQLGAETIAKINFCLNKYEFPSENEKHLVHADFDPANILVDKVDGNWKVSAVLDWEFSFSGSVLCDVANMLRYKHKMPTEFENSFLKGLKEGGVVLSKEWQTTTHMLNLLSLLDCLVRSDPRNRPNQLADIKELIDHILKELV